MLNHDDLKKYIISLKKSKGNIVFVIPPRAKRLSLKDRPLLHFLRAKTAIATSDVTGQLTGRRSVGKKGEEDCLLLI